MIYNAIKMRRPIFDTIKSLSCEIIVSDFKKFSEYKSDSKIHSALSLYCKNVLLNQIIESNSNLNLSSNKLAKVYGIVHIHAIEINTKNNAQSGTVMESTKVIILSIHSSDYHRLSLQNEILPKMGGLDAEFEKIERLFSINRSSTKFYRPHGILLHGPPGCGKSSFGRSLAKKCSALFYNVEASNLLTSDFGSGANTLKDIFEKVIPLLEEGPVILFFDELDVLCPRPESASLGNKQLSNALMTQMDEIHCKNIPGLLILAVTNAISSIDPCLRRPGRFDQEILINVPSEAQRFSILQILTADSILSSDVSCKALAQLTPGFVGADLRGLCEEAIDQAQRRATEASTVSTVLSMDDFYQALHKTTPSLKKGSECTVDIRPVKWEDIGSLDEIKAQIKQSIEWPLIYPEVLKRMDIPPAKGILLYGPPGCCKTTLVRAAATSCNVSFLSLSGAQVYSAYVGESERLVSQAFQKARALAPSILFFDEIETLVGKRVANVGNNRVQERILSTMLNEMDGIGNKLDNKVDASYQKGPNCSGMQKTLEGDTVSSSQYAPDSSTSNLERGKDYHATDSTLNKSNPLRVIVVGATNRPDMLDPAILRPGRLDKHIYVPPPDDQAREAILNIYTSKMPCTEIDISQLADKTNLYSGADLKNLCKEAGLQAVRSRLTKKESLDNPNGLVVTNQHFMQALDVVKPSLTVEMLLEYNKK